MVDGVTLEGQIDLGAQDGRASSRRDVETEQVASEPQLQPKTRVEPEILLHPDGAMLFPHPEAVEGLEQSPRHHVIELDVGKIPGYKRKG